MSESIILGIRLVNEYLEAAIDNIETGSKAQALGLITTARQRLQELEIDLQAEAPDNPSNNDSLN